MGNRFPRRDKEKDEDKYRRYLENSKGDLIDAFGLSRLNPAPTDIVLFPATPVYECDCREPGMRREMLRYGTFQGSPNRTPRPPSVLAAAGFYFQQHTARILCFCCGADWPQHRHDCRRRELNIPFHQGVGEPPPPSPTLQQFLVPGGRLVLRGPPVCQAVDDTPDVSLRLSRQERSSRVDDHDIHPVPDQRRGSTPGRAPHPALQASGTVRQPAPQACGEVRQPAPQACGEVPQAAPQSCGTASGSATPAVARAQGQTTRSTPSTVTPTSHAAESQSTATGSDRTVHRSATQRIITPPPQPRLCKICRTRPMSAEFLPCGHVACCWQCAESLSPRFCPQCHRPFQKIQIFERL